MQNIEKAIQEINEILEKNNCYFEISEWLSIFDKDGKGWREIEVDPTNSAKIVIVKQKKY